MKDVEYNKSKDYVQGGEDEEEDDGWEEDAD